MLRLASAAHPPIRKAQMMTRTVVSNERAGDLDAAREAALKLLERTRRTRSDLARRLKDKGYAAAAIEPVLERLVGVGLVDEGLARKMTGAHDAP